MSRSRRSCPTNPSRWRSNGLPTSVTRLGVRCGYPSRRSPGHHGLRANDRGNVGPHLGGLRRSLRGAKAGSRLPLTACAARLLDWVCHLGPVADVMGLGCQKSACTVTCGDTQGKPYGIMIIRVPAPALPHLCPGLRLAGPARPVTGPQERRAARTTARGRRAAPRQSPGPARLGRPHGPRRAHPAPAGQVAGAPAGTPGTVLRWHRHLIAASRLTRTGRDGLQ